MALREEELLERFVVVISGGTEMVTFTWDSTA